MVLELEEGSLAPAEVLSKRQYETRLQTFQRFLRRFSARSLRAITLLLVNAHFSPPRGMKQALKSDRARVSIAE